MVARVVATLLGALAVDAFSPTAAAQRARCGHVRASAAIASDADEARLLTEVRKDERSLPAIQGLVDALAAEDAPAKPKRALLGDWELEYASDADAVSLITTGEIGNFAVVEGVVHRYLKDNAVETIEVARQFGPFGNARRALNGKWSVEKSGSDAMVRWRYTYLIDQFGRERDPPSAQLQAGTHEVLVGYLSANLMLLTRGDAVLVFSRVPNLIEWLEENRVATEEEIKANAPETA